MKILLLADQAEPTLWEHLDKRKLEGVELVLSCGDLPASYLSFLTCFTSAPILYIRGNHDDRYDKHPPEGCRFADRCPYAQPTCRGMKPEVIELPNGREYRCLMSERKVREVYANA